jgi:hypothetical protein
MDPKPKKALATLYGRTTTTRTTRRDTSLAIYMI